MRFFLVRTLAGVFVATAVGGGCQSNSSDRASGSGNESPGVPVGRRVVANKTALTPARRVTVFEKNKPAVETPIRISPARRRDGAELVLTERDRKTIERLEIAEVKAVTPLSPRTLSVLLRLDDGKRAVFKPGVRGDDRPRHEVAAFRISRWFGIEGVPAATMRSLPFEFLAARLENEDPKLGKRFRRRRPDNPEGLIEGAIIEWLPELEPAGYRALGGKEGLLALVRKNSAPHPLGEQVGAMLLFDYLIGNWDRFSGGNVFVSEDGAKLALIDHNSSFEIWSNRQRRRMEGLLDAVEKRACDFQKKLEQLDRALLLRIVTEDSARGPLLTPEEIDVTLKRKRSIVEHLAEVDETKISKIEL